MTRVLFVCLGNICRSPAAEGVLRAKAKARGLALTVASAGTGGWHAGEQADARMIEAAARRGYNLSDHRARQFTDADFYEFDWILAMDGRNLADICNMAPRDAEARVNLFLEFANLGRTNTPDPYYGGPEGFDRVLDLAEEGAEGVLLRLAGLRR
jgi:protein-tyrosine phosphatase